MSDENPPGSQASQQREIALWRWENEGGSGPPEPSSPAAGLAFNGPDALRRNAWHRHQKAALPEASSRPLPVRPNRGSCGKHAP